MHLFNLIRLYICKSLKRIFSIVFIAAFVFQSMSGLYVLANFYINRAYISKNICENRFDAVSTCGGKCYLAKELKQKEQQQEEFPDLKQKEINLYYEDSSLDKLFNTELATDVSFISPDNFYTGSYHSAIFHPPCVA